VLVNVTGVALRKMILGAITARNFGIAAVVHLSGIPGYAAPASRTAVFVAFETRLPRDSYVASGQIDTLVRRIVSWMCAQRNIRIPAKELAGLRGFGISLMWVPVHTLTLSLKTLNLHGCPQLSF
jgi:hypothetical protein